MKRVASLCLLAGLASGAFATIGDGGPSPIPASATYASGKLVRGNPELFLSVFDAEAKVSYTLDLGLDMNSFLTNAQQDAGMQWFKPVDDANWSSFLERAGLDRLRWVVLAGDNDGLTAAGEKRWLMTVRQGGEAAVRNWTNQAFANSLAEATYGRFLVSVNETGSHVTPKNDYRNHGSSVNAPTDASNKRAYFGKQTSGASFDETLGTFAQGFGVDNKLGESSWFYYVTRSGTSNASKVLVDEFDNLGADGYWGFTYVDPAKDASSPYAGKFLLSYTLDKAGVKATTAAGMLRMSLTDYLAADRFLPLLLQQGSLAGEYQGYRQSSLVLPDGGLPGLGGTNSMAAGLSPVSAVPEPASWGLMGLGLAGLLAWRRRQQAAGG